MGRWSIRCGRALEAAPRAWGARRMVARVVIPLEGPGTEEGALEGVFQ